MIRTRFHLVFTCLSFAAVELTGPLAQHTAANRPVIRQIVKNDDNSGKLIIWIFLVMRLSDKQLSVVSIQLLGAVQEVEMYIKYLTQLMCRQVA